MDEFTYFTLMLRQAETGSQMNYHAHKADIRLSAHTKAVSPHKGACLAMRELAERAAAALPR